MLISGAAGNRRNEGEGLSLCKILAARVFALSIALPTTLPITLLMLASAPGFAQTPVTGFVPPYEIVRTVHAAGFDPLAPPRREGTTYVLRATDFRGILMRVVVDARTGAIRDANRIVPGPGFYGPGGYGPGGYYGGYGPGAYSPSLYGPRSYGPETAPHAYGPDASPRPLGAGPPSSEGSADDMTPPTETPPSRIGTPGASPPEEDVLAEPPQQQSARSVVGAPLPRPRPATLAAAKPSQDERAAATYNVSNSKPVEGKPDTKPTDSKPRDNQPDVATTAPAVPPKSPSAKPGKASNLPAIND